MRKTRTALPPVVETELETRGDYRREMNRVYWGLRVGSVNFQVANACINALKNASELLDTKDTDSDNDLRRALVTIGAAMVSHPGSGVASPESEGLPGIEGQVPDGARGAEVVQDGVGQEKGLNGGVAE